MSELAKVLKVEHREITSRLNVKKVFDDIFGSTQPRWNVVKVKAEFTEKNIKKQLEDIEDVLASGDVDEHTKKDLLTTREELCEELSNLITKSIPANV